MRRLIVILLAVCFFFLLAFIFIRPIIILFAKKQLGNIFIKSQVSIDRCAFHPLSGLSIIGIDIKKQGLYDIKVKEAAIQYNLFSILKAGSLKLSLKGPAVYANTPKKPVNELAEYLNIGRGAPIFKSVEISDMALDLNTSDLTVKATLAARLNLVTQSPDYLNFKMSSFSMLGVQMENVLLEFGPGSGKGQFSIPLLKYNKLSVTDIKGNIKLQDKAVSAYSVSASVLGGNIQLDLGFKVDKEAPFSLDLKCMDLDIEKFISDFDLREKFNMTGILSGNMKLNGKAGKIEIVEGNFSTLPPGGRLVITDTTYLENMAQSTHQPTDLLVESFKDYRYNTGLMSLGLQAGNIVLKISLEGEAGKRDLNIILHDFKIGKE